MCLSKVMEMKSLELPSLYINCLGLYIVLKTLKHFPLLLTDKNVMIKTDNKTAAAYIHKSYINKSLG